MQTTSPTRWTYGLAVAGLVAALALSDVLARQADDHAIGAALKEGAMANTVSAEVQQRISTLDDERAAMFDEYRHLLRQAESLERFQEHLQKLVAGQEEELAVLASREATIAETHRELLPLMQRMLSTLEDWVALDFPFLQAERQARLERLNELMHAPGIGLAEKYRRILEAYQVEAEYGKTIEAYRAPLDMGGVNADGAANGRIVDVLRVGRVGLFYLSPDRGAGGAWDAQTGSWHPLNPAQRRRLQSALRVANKTMAPTLLELPVRLPERKP